MTDEDLMHAVCNGDQSAYQTLVKKYLKPISHYAWRLLGNSKDTEDITQETFLRMWVNAAQWQPDKANLSTWLHRITHNLCIDYLRKHRHVVMATDAGADMPITHTDADSDSTETCDDGVPAQQLQRALQGLPEAQRSALMLCHYQGFSNKEAAAIMDISVKALESAIARAKRTLRTQLQQHRDQGY